MRDDAAFAKSELYEVLEKRGVRYAIRIPSNDILEREVEELLRRSVGRPGHTPVVRFKSFRYQAASWKTARRVVAKIEFHCGELFPRVGFIVTTLEMDSRAVVHFYAFPDPLFRRPRLLLATARGGAPDTASVRGDRTAARDAVGAGGIAAPSLLPTVRPVSEVEWCPRNRLPTQLYRTLGVQGGHKRAFGGLRGRALDRKSQGGYL